MCCRVLEGFLPDVGVDRQKAPLVVCKGIQLISTFPQPRLLYGLLMRDRYFANALP
jgi:hypothetical protein